MVTAITEQTRNASKASRSLNTIFARLSQVTDDASSTGKKLTAIYNELGISLYDSEGQLRSSYDILSDLSQQWDNLSQNEKNYIALTSAGSNQLNAFLALMENFGHATDATGTALNSAGSAARENSRYMEGLQAKCQAVKSAFQEFANNVLSSDLVGGILTAGKAILDFANTDLGQFIAKLLLANLAIQAGAGLWANFGNLISGIINPMSGLNTVIQGGITIFGALRGSLTNIVEGFQIVSTGAGTLGEVFTQLGSGASTFGAVLASINPIFALVAAAAIAAAAAYRHFHVTAEEQAQVVSDLSSKVSQLKSEYDTLASSDNLTAADQERLDILQKQIEANETLLAQEAQKSYQMSYGESSKHSVEVSDEQRDANVEQYNKLTDEINKESEALNQLQQSYDSVTASEGSNSQAAKDIQNQMIQTQQHIADLRKEQENFAISDAGTVQLTGLEEIENKITTLQHLKQSIADNKEEMDKLDGSTTEGANKINELADKNSELQSSYTDLNAEVANDIQSLQELGDTMGGLPDDAQDVIDAWLDFNQAQEDVEKSAEKLEERIRKIADVEIKPKDADSMGEWLESLGETDLEHLEYLLTEVGSQAEWFSAQLAGMGGDEAVSYINEVFQRLSGSIRDAGEAYSEFEEALQTDYSEPLKQVYEMMDYITQSTENGITNLKAYNASLQGIYGTTDKNIIKIAEQNAAISDFRNVAQEAAEGQATLAGNIEQYFQNGVFQGDLLLDRMKELGTSATAISKYGKLLDFQEFDDGTFEIAINDFSKLSEVLGLTDPVLKSFMNSMAGTVDFQIGDSIDAVTNAIQRLHDEASKTGTGEISNIANEVRAMGDNINSSDLGVKRLEELQDKLNALSQYTNVSFDYDFSKLAETGDLKGAADEITAYATALQNLTTEAGDWDIQGLVDSVNEGLSEGQGIEIDGDSIKFNSQEAVDAFKKQLSDAFGGMDYTDIVTSDMGRTIMSNLFSGLTVDESNFKGIGSDVANTIKNVVQEKLNTTQLTINGVGAEVASDMGIAIQGMNDYSESVKNAKSDTENLNNVSLSNAQSEIKKVGSSAQTADSHVRTLWTDIRKLNTTVTTKFVSDTSGYKVPSTPTGSTVTVKGQKAVGQIPAYASGLEGTQPMRLQYSGMSLVGEEGAEFKISKDGKKELVGQDGAEFVKVDKGDTIIPADATEMIRSGQLNGFDGGLRGRTTATGSGVANASHNVSVGDVKSRYTGNTITSISKATATTTSNTKATASNTSAKTANASANSSAAEATDELTDAQKEQNEAFQDANDIAEHHIWLREKQGASYEELIKMSRDYQKQLHEQADWWRSQGFDDDSEEVRKIVKSWWSVEDDITSYQEKAFDKRLQESEDYIDERNDLNDWGADSEIDAWHRVEVWMDEWYSKGLISYEYYLEKRKDATKKAAEAEKKAWETAKKAQQSALEERQQVYEDLFDLVADKADEEINKLNDQRDVVEKYWQDKIDALNDANDALDDQIEREEALDALARARSTKVMVYQDGRFQYINDIDQVSEAKANLEKIERDQALKQEVANLEKSKEEALAAIDAQIKAWEDYKDEWSSVVSEYEKEQKRLNVLQKLGIDLEADNWKERLGNLEDYVSQYKKLMAELTKVNEELEAGYGSSSGGGFSSSGAAAGAGAGTAAGVGIGSAIGGVAGGGIGAAIGGAIGAVTGGLAGNKSNSSSGSKSSSSGSYTASGGYTIGSEKGKSFVDNAKAGSTMTGGDGSTWTKNKDGSTTIKTKDGTTHTVSKRASGTKYAPAGMSLVGEEGAELRVLGQGDGIIPHDLTSNLFEWGQTKPSDIVSAFNNAQKQNNGVTIHIDNFNPNLPNVTDGEGFANYLKNNFWRSVAQYKTNLGRA